MILLDEFYVCALIINAKHSIARKIWEYKMGSDTISNCWKFQSNSMFFFLGWLGPMLQCNMGILQIYLSKVKANSQRWQCTDKIVRKKGTKEETKKPMQLQQFPKIIAQQLKTNMVNACKRVPYYVFASVSYFRFSFFYQFAVVSCIVCVHFVRSIV